jgi:hypothetical protein
MRKHALEATTIVFAFLLGGGNASAQGVSEEAVFRDAFDDPLACQPTITLPDGSIRHLLTLANIRYGVFPQQRPDVDVRQWDNVWGYYDTTSAQVGWPGVTGSLPVIPAFPRDAYVGVHFHTPPAATNSGYFSNPSSVLGPAIDMSISRGCGDFDAYMETAGCIARNVPTSDSNLVLWKFTANNPSASCNLRPDTDYYVNIVITDPATTNGCAAASPTCPVGVVSYHN